MSSIKTTMTLDAQQVIAEQKRAGESMAGVVQAYKEASNEAARLSSVASRALRDSLSPAERYEQKLEDLGRALKAGKLNEEQYAKAVAHTKQKFEESQRSGMQFEAVMQTVASTATGMLSLSGAIGFVTDALREAHEEAKQVAEVMKSNFASRGALAQVATSADDFAALNAQSAEFRLNGGAQSRQIADGIVFALRSTGLSDEASMFQRVGRTGLVSADNMQPMIEAIDSLRDAMSVAEVGTAESALSKALVASGVSQVPADVILRATAKAGQAARSSGVGDEELMSSIALLTDPLTSPDTAADRMRAFFNATKVNNLDQGGLLPTLDSITARVNAGENIRDVLGGDQGALEAYGLMTRPDIRAQLGVVAGQIGAANDGKALADKFAILEGDATQRALMQEQATQGANEIARQDMGRREVLTQALVSQEDELFRQRGYGAVSRSLFRLGREGVAGVGGIRDDPGFRGQLYSPEALEGMRQQATAAGNQEMLRTLAQIEQTQKELTELIRSEKAERARRATAPSIPAPEN